ncbi:MAG: S9 family peptidase [Acidobacteria bacterium]|uniref:S9 family peptidase n=1 Tax=Candidatus Polarisedimenticola svalbardensis TaxID=2886004 RepID=A0A8J6XXC3_9BACT|nr:S9 family peptidase [Candidatus Polarisedimenticola svalbardensis]
MGKATKIRKRALVCKGLICLAALLATLSGLQAAALTPPAEAFGMRPHLAQVLLSPAGTHYACVQWAKGRPYLAVYDLTGTADKRFKLLELEISDFVVERVGQIHWFNDDTIGVVIQFESSREGMLTLETRLFVVNRGLNKGHWIPERKRLKWAGSQPAPISQFYHRIIDYLPGDPDHILMAIDLFARGTDLSAVRVNIKTGTMTTVEPGDEEVAGFDVDQQGRVRLRHEIKGNQRIVSVRDLDSGKWSPFQTAPRTEGFALRPQAFTENGRGLWVFQANQQGFDEIFEYDLKLGQISRKILGLPRIDLHYLATDRYTRKVLGATYAAHHQAVHYFDEQLADLQLKIDEALPDTRNSIENFDRKRKLFIVLATGPRVPGTFYLFSRERLELTMLGQRYASRLEPGQLHDVEPVSYAARDGLTIPGYLTRPDGTGPLPMVVMPHGGPTARDFQAFHPIAQFLASRGYLVLQPNFRGSSGYGSEFQKAGHGEWGLAMSDDVTDGVKAMIERGVADPDRICIVGWSYGGYAALMGAVKTPDLYRCAVSGAGVTDIRKMLSESTRYKFGLKNYPSIGNFRKDKDKLKDTSPINNIEAIKIPILLVHGDKDLSVPIAHSKMMARKLKKQGKPYRLVVLKDGNHNMALEKNRVRYIKELEAFLGEHLGEAED